MKVLWTSNAPWVASGYGQQTQIFTPRLKAAGYDVAIFASYGLGGDKTTWEGMTVYPAGMDAYGNDAIVDYSLMHFDQDPNAGWLFILYDAWVFRNPHLGRVHKAVWAPVDHDPAPPEVAQFFRTFDGVPVAMSRFGQDKFAQVDLEALYLPHGYHPAYEPKPQADGRAALKLPEDAFIVGTNLTNKGVHVHRKAYSQVFEGFMRFSRKHPDALLYVHAEASGYDHTVGWDLHALAATFEITDKVRFADQHTFRMGVPVDAMPWLYSSFDVLLHSTLGEGFGIPIIEAQACGVPVVVTNHTSMPELCGDGWIVDGIHQWDDRSNAFWKIPHPYEIADALTEAYERPRGTSEKAVEFARAYHADTVFTEHMIPVFENLRERIDPGAL